MSNLPLISIVIPCYNSEKYLEETLKSIFTQKYSNLELIIQDGGSKDKTVSIVKFYAKKYPGIVKWVSKKDKGQVDAINKGLKKAKGDIVTFINSDDIYLPGALRIIGAYFSKYPETLWLTGKGKIVDEKGREIVTWVTWYKNLLLAINSYRLLLITNYITQPSVFLSRIAYEKYGPFTGVGRIVMEYGLWLELGRVKMPKLIDKYISSFRLTSQNLSSTQSTGILSTDYDLASKYTKDTLTLYLHKIHNRLRVVVLRLIFGL